MSSRRSLTSRTFTSAAGLAVAALLGVSSLWSQAAAAAPRRASAELSQSLPALVAGWEQPGRSYKSHTRWWWPGNALTKADITFQLEQMAAQGFGGVEIMSAWKMYEKGNHDYLSPEFLALVRHAVAEGKRLDFDVALTFSPGWSFGGPWVAPEDQSRVLCVGETDVAAGAHFRAALPRPTFPASRHSAAASAEHGRLVAVVAARVLSATTPSAATAKAAKRKKAPATPAVALRLDPTSTVVLTDRVGAGSDRLDWQAPAGGRWRLMAFWLVPTGQECQAQNAVPPAMVIDHLNRDAVQRYCDQLGGIFARELGADFGTTVDSLFCDSFEIHPLPNSLLWSYDTLARFREFAGYDLTPHLPVLWHDLGANAPRLRYDVGAFLHTLALDTFYRTFGDWCRAHRIQARIQPHYRFPPELVQAAGVIDRPETEVTTARFETVPDPRKATASGARFYGRAIVSAESYTFIHPARYRTDLQDLKIATDAFLRDGVTQFYNHGYFASPEAHVAPSRDMPWANRISHWNTWWPYYRHFAAYVARSCFLLRQGRLVADVLIYTPQATAWSERALWGAERRVMPYGDLAKTLVANGYDYDIVNDDLLQNHTRLGDGQMEINGHARRVLILPRATVVPIATMRAIAGFARRGGTVIALEALPAAAAGMREAEANDREVGALVREVFAGSASGRATNARGGAGRGVFLPEYVISRTPFNPARQPYTPTPPLNEAQRRLLAALGRVTPPDFALAGGAQSDGLTFQHRQVENLEVYFVTNLQPKPIATAVTFRATGGRVERWNALTGERRRIAARPGAAGRTTLPLDFAPWESAFFVFAPAPTAAATKAEARGGFDPALRFAAKAEARPPEVLAGPWNMRLEGHAFEPYSARLTTLSSWTDTPRTRHFSGTGRYECEFELAAEWLLPGRRLLLDLGQVGTIAEVELNGTSIGVAWMAPYRLDVTPAARSGRNRLVVRVTNTLINHVTGLKEPPDVPAELQPRLGRANPAIYPQSQLARREMSETDLPPSGLLGPIQIGWAAEPAPAGN